MTAEEPVRVWKDAGIGWMTLDRPQRFNSLDVDTARLLHRAASECGRDPAVQVVVLQGGDGIFCSGADLKYISVESQASGRGYGAYFRDIVGSLHQTILELRRSPKPVIVAVDGVAAAGGMGLALGCGDLVLASERATFEYAYFKTGLSGAESTTFFLPRLAGPNRAAALALLSPRLSAREACAHGLVTTVYGPGELAGGVQQLAGQLAAGPAGAYATAKRLMNETLGVDDLEAHLAEELDALCVAADSADFAEGLNAFFEKRPPRFAGQTAGSPTN
jgi:2-(1,2-epoxy-1,2-dihydrophenyl)acetyl-CoA isomerase